MRGVKGPRRELIAEDCFDEIMEAVDTKLARALFDDILAKGEDKVPPEVIDMSEEVSIENEDKISDVQVPTK